QPAPAGRGRPDRRGEVGEGSDRRRARTGRSARRRAQAVPALLPRHAPAPGHRRRPAAPRDLLILDEPTNGLDPQGTPEVRALLTALAATGTTVMLSTHLLSEVEQVCSHVGVMHLGKLVAQGPLAELRARTAPQVEVLSTDPAGAARVLDELGLTQVATAAETVTGLLGA